MRNRASNKILAFVLAAVMALGSVFAAPPMTAYAVDIGTKDNMVAGGIVVGTTGNSNPTVIGFGGYQWRVIGHNGNGVASENNTLTLLLGQNYLPKVTFNNGSATNDHNSYAGGNLQTAMQRAYDDIPNAKERELVLPRDIDAKAQGVKTTETVENQYFWPLSKAEAQTLDRDAIKRDFSGEWWLRSPGEVDDNATYVDNSGNVYPDGYEVDYSYAIRPAFKLNLSSVIFTSAASGANAKPAAVGATLSAAGAPTGAVKLTILDSGQILEDVVLSDGAETGTLPFSYNNSTATTGTNQYISCVLVGTQGADNGKVKYYGKLKDLTGGRGNGSVDIPLNGVANGIYTLKIFNEQANGNNLTDFCSTPVTMKISVSSEQGTVLSDDAGLTSVAAQTITTTGGTGTDGDPKTAAISVENSKASIVVGDIIAATDATAALYSDNAFSQNLNQPITLTEGGATHAYIKVTAEDSSTAYYDITINRAAASITDITAASIMLVAPVYNVNSTAASVSAADYSHTSTSWAVTGGGALALGSPFAASTEYTATIVLTSQTGYKFAASVQTSNITMSDGGTVESATTNGGSISGNTLAVVVDYAATGAAPTTPTLTMTPVKPALTIGAETDGQTVATAAASNFSGAVTYSIYGTPALPAGLSIDNSTGEISVTNASALVAAPATTVTVKAESGGESATGTVTITINDAPEQDTAPLINGQVNGTDTITLSLGYSGYTRNYTVTGTPTLSVSIIGANTAGASVTSGGALTIPAGLGEGSYETAIKAVNNEGAATMTITVNVTDTIPLPTGEYTVTVQTDGNGTADAFPPVATAGTTVNLSATPNTNYSFSRWEAVSPPGLAINGNSFEMPDEAVTVKAYFEQIYTPTPPSPPTPTTGRDRDSDSGSSYTPPAAPPSTLILDAAKVKAALAERERTGASKTRIRHNGEIKVPTEVWPLFGNVPVDFDTTGSPVQVRVTVREPGKMTGDKLMSGYIKGSIVDSRKTFFEKWFKNEVRVIHFDQQGGFGQPVEIAARFDLNGIDTENLYLYSYDKKTNTYKRIEKPAYWIDKNGYLRFTTEYAGDIVISMGSLEKKT